jgi:hypothetical protein
MWGIKIGERAVIQSLLSIRKLGVCGVDTAVDGCGKAVLARGDA